MGLASGTSTRDFACQACGARFSLSPMKRIYVAAAVTVLLSWTCIFPLITLPVLAYQGWPYLRNPVVPGAPAPELRFLTVEPIRRCAACGGVAACTSVTRHRSSGIPMGTTFEYRCRGCARTFKLASWGGHLVNGLGAVVCLVMGAFCFPVGIVLWLLALGAVVLSTLQLVAAVRNPLIAEAVKG
jgi:hypothetical protein